MAESAPGACPSRLIRLIEYQPRQPMEPCAVAVVVALDGASGACIGFDKTHVHSVRRYTNRILSEDTMREPQGLTPPAKKTKAILIRVDPQTMERWRTAAAKHGCSVAALIRWSVDRALLSASETPGRLET